MSATMGCDVEGSLKEALYETLNGVLSSHRETRQAAEQRIQALEVTDDFGIHLSEFVVDPGCWLAIRQLASVLLKQYVETHWNSSAEKFRPPELRHATKERIKELLPLGLRESVSKVRASVAYAISAIAHWDWPENWPGLFDILVSCLSSEDENPVDGAMRVLTEFSRDLTDTQLPNVGPVILEEMYRIFQSENQYSIGTRGRAVDIFSTIATLVASTGHYQRGFTQRYLQPVIPMFVEKFVYYLRVPNGPASDNAALKTDIIKAINGLMLHLPKYMANFLPQILPPVWETMTQIAKVYQDETVNGGDDHLDDSDDVAAAGVAGAAHRGNEKQVDYDDDETANLNNLIIATFEFIHSLIDHRIVDDKRFSSLLENLVQQAMYYLVIFMQITEEQIQLWTRNPSQLVEEYDEQGFAYNVRISAQELLTELVSHSEVSSINALCEMITRHIEETGRQRNAPRNTALSGDGGGDVIAKNWWKMYEASILGLCVVKDEVMEMLEAGTLRFDLVRFLDSVVLTTLNDSGAHPLLLGRCLCAGGRFARQLPLDMALRFLEATVNGLQENQPACIRISAVKAVYWFCEASIAGNPTIESIMRNHLPAIFQGIFSLTSQPDSQILTLVMETFAVLVTIDKTFTASIENKICPFTIAVFLKFHSDPEILALCQDILKALTENPQCIGPLQTRILPTLISMMAYNPMDKLKEEGTRGVALDVLQVLVQYSPKPLSSGLVDNAFPAACHCILNSDDNGILQSGGEVIRTYLSVAARQVTEHRDNDGCTGLQYILQIVAQLLNPRASEFTATFVGRLVTTLIRKVGSSLGEHLDLVLKAVLSKMQQVDTLTVMQSLLMIYAHLINTEFEAVLNFLSTVPGPTGESALAFVLTEWVSRQQLFFGAYDRKVSTVALSKILEHGVTNDDSRLNEITVEGEEIFAENERGARTRSKTLAQPCQWTTIPVLVKILKLIINELSNDIETVRGTRCTENSGDDTDDEDGDGDDDDGQDDDRILDPGDGTDLLRIESQDEEKEEDPDLLQDSIYHLNLNQYLRDFLTNFSSHHCFPAFVQHLNVKEREVLASLNISATYA